MVLGIVSVYQYIVLYNVRALVSVLPTELILLSANSLLCNSVSSFTFSQ